MLGQKNVKKNVGFLEYVNLVFCFRYLLTFSMQNFQESELNCLETHKQEQHKKTEFSKTPQNRSQKYVNSEFKTRGFLFLQLAFLM